jgi:hypothetical protein
MGLVLKIDKKHFEIKQSFGNRRPYILVALTKYKNLLKKVFENGNEIASKEASFKSY